MTKLIEERDDMKLLESRKQEKVNHYGDEVKGFVGKGIQQRKYNSLSTLFISILLLISSNTTLTAQEENENFIYSISTNTLDYINFLTFNIEGGISINKNTTLTLSGRYNPFIYNKWEIDQIQNKRLSAAIGIKYWPWFTNSSWFLSGKLQSELFNYGGSFLLKGAEEGYRIGGSVGIGYAIMLNSHFNLELGAGLWLGYEHYSRYACINCGKVVSRGNRFFTLPDNFQISIVYIFN